MASIVHNETTDVRSIDMDQYISGNIIFTTSCCIWTTDGMAKTLIAGGTNPNELGYRENVGVDARFRYPTGFVQIKCTYVVLADAGNKCLRMVNRTNDQTSEFSGLCTSVNSTLIAPFDVERDRMNKNQLLITDSNVQAVFVADAENGNLSVFAHDASINNARGLTQDHSGNILITCRHAVYKISYLCLEIK